MSREIVIDIETKDTFQEVGGFDPSKLHVSLVGLYDYATDRYETFLEQDLPGLWAILERADGMVGYNVRHFDIPVLNRYYPGDLTIFPTIDLLVEIEKSLGFRVKLEDVGQATLGRGKTGTGFKAIEYWRNGEIDKLRSYCLEDVRLTKDIYDYARAHGTVLVRDRMGVMHTVPIKVPLELVAAPRINLTMPF